MGCPALSIFSLFLSSHPEYVLSCLCISFPKRWVYEEEGRRLFSPFFIILTGERQSQFETRARTWMREWPSVPLSQGRWSHNMFLPSLQSSCRLDGDPSTSRERERETVYEWDDDIPEEPKEREHCGETKFTLLSLFLPTIFNQHGNEPLQL